MIIIVIITTIINIVTIIWIFSDGAGNNDGEQDYNNEDYGNELGKLL